jgi:hypothetical protein
MTSCHSVTNPDTPGKKPQDPDMLPLPKAAYDACLRISMVPPEALKSRDDRHNWPVRSKHKFFHRGENSQ